MKHTHYTLLLATLAIIGCNNNKNVQPPEAKVPVVVRHPPEVPPAKAEPRDENLRDVARSEIEKQFANNDEVVRAHAIEAAKEAMGVNAKKLILRGLSDKSALVRFAACASCGELRIAESYEPVSMLLSDEDPSVRIASRYALHRLGDSRHTQEMATYVLDPRKEIRGNAVMLMGQLGEKSAIKILQKMRNDKEPVVRLQTAEAMWRLGDERGLEDLVVATISSFPDEQIVGILGLAAPGDHRVIEHVRGKLISDYDEVKLAAARAAGELGSDDGYSIAMQSLHGKDPRQRVLAAMALGAIGRIDAQKALGGLLNDTDADVRLAAATAIWQLHNGMILANGLSSQ